MTAIFQKFAGSGFILILFVLALIYLFFCEKRKSRRIMLVYVPAIVLLFFFNPLFFKLFYNLVGDEIYFRIIWLMPVTVVMGYTVVHIAERLQGKKRIGFAFVAVLILMLSGKLVYSSPLYSKAENQYHMPQAVVDICDAIEIEGREVMAAFPPEFLLYVRQYSPVVCMPYGRDAVMGIYSEFEILMYEEEIEVEKLAQLAKESLCHYVILSEEKVLIGDMEDYDYEVYDTMHGYVIYRDKTMNYDTYMQ
ncbi:MAG: hypothetical protein IJ282_02365 [Lachnospiraceae bacterium]|nr:hypothetical protein [Lachnospiraceae bacterium]